MARGKGATARVVGTEAETEIKIKRPDHKKCGLAMTLHSFLRQRAVTRLRHCDSERKRSWEQS